MKKELELIPPMMPNFVRFKQKAGLRQEGFKTTEGFPVKDFTEEEAIEFGELMKQEFIKHWKFKQVEP